MEKDHPGPHRGGPLPTRDFLSAGCGITMTTPLAGGEFVSRDVPLSSEALRFFLVVASAPSLAAASRSLDVSRSAVTQRLSQLEAGFAAGSFIAPRARSG